MLSGWLTSPAEAARARQRLWTGELDWVRIPGTCLAERARFLDVFLDALAGANTDASWVLDGRFEALLVDGDVATARDARAGSGTGCRTGSRGGYSAPNWPATGHRQLGSV